MESKHYIKWGAWLTILFTLFLYYLQPSGAFSQDLGRHLKLGQIIWETKVIPKTNLFSYTNPDFPFINHHWLSEVIFYLLYQIFGVISLVWLRIMILLVAFGIVFQFAQKQAGTIIAGFVATLVLPLFKYRMDERPEIFGFLFFAFLFWFLFSGKKYRRIYYFVLPLVMLLWVNMHLSFIYGVFLIGVYWLTVVAAFKKKQLPQSEFVFFSFVCGLSVLVTLINPFGMWGATYPLRIFTNYGYQIVENQSVFYLWSYRRTPILIYFMLVATLFSFVVGLRVLFQSQKKGLSILYFIFTLVALMVVRNVPFFALVSLPVVCLCLKQLLAPFLTVKKVEKNLLLTFLAVIAFLNFGLWLFFSDGQPAQPGIPEVYKPAADFFLEKKLPAYVFNDFDTGGYLDYRFYPTYQVFVDNRPEAFPKEFFADYIRMQIDPPFQRDIFTKYHVKSIFFSLNEATSWGQDFVQQIITDPNWQVVYVDNFAIILVDKDEAEKRQLPEVKIKRN